MKPVGILLVLLVVISFAFSSAWKFAKPCPVNSSFRCGWFVKYCDEADGTWKCDFGLQHQCPDEQLPKDMVCHCQHHDGVNICSFPSNGGTNNYDKKEGNVGDKQIEQQALPDLSKPSHQDNKTQQEQKMKNDQEVISKEGASEHLIPKLLTDSATSSKTSQQDKKRHHQTTKKDNKVKEKDPHVEPKVSTNSAESAMTHQHDIKRSEGHQQTKKKDNEVNKEVPQVAMKPMADFWNSLIANVQDDTRQQTTMNYKEGISKQALQVTPNVMADFIEPFMRKRRYWGKNLNTHSRAKQMHQRVFDTMPRSGAFWHPVLHYHRKFPIPRDILGQKVKIGKRHGKLHEKNIFGPWIKMNKSPKAKRGGRHKNVRVNKLRSYYEPHSLLLGYALGLLGLAI